MELFTSKTFQAMESSLYALQIQTQVSAQNIANVSTPGYKAKKVVFEDVLKDAKGANGHFNYRAKVIEDDSTLVRPDGNNVQVDAENEKLSKAYYQSLYLMQKISGQFSNMRYVLENSPK